MIERMDRPQQPREIASEIFALFREHAELTERALASLARDEVDVLTESLERRQEVIDRATPLLDRLLAPGRRTSDAHDAGETGALVTAVEHGARMLQKAEAELMAALTVRRDEISAALDKLDAGASTRAGYASGAAASSIDIVQ